MCCVCVCLYIYHLHLQYDSYHLCNGSYSAEYLLIEDTKSFSGDSKKITLSYLRSNQSGFSCDNSLYPRTFPLFSPSVKVMDLSLTNMAAKENQKRKYWSSIKEGFDKKLKRGIFIMKRLYNKLTSPLSFFIIFE